MDLFTSDKKGNFLPISPDTYTRYSDLISMIYLFADCAFFIVLTWYFDHVVESNRGRGDSPLFPFVKIYNFFKKNRDQKKIIPSGIDQLRNPNFMLQD